MCFFPNLYKTLHVSTTKACMIDDLFDFLSQNERFTVKSFYAEGIVFDVKNTNLFMHNSFLPTVNVTIYEAAPLRITISASLKKSTKVILTLLTMIAAVFEVVLGITMLANNYDNALILLLPLGLVLAIFLLAYIGLSVSAKDIVKELTTVIAYKTGGCSLS